jgi:hypothetical protein
MPKEFKKLDNDAIKAQKELRELIAAPPMLFIVLGDDKDAADLADIANAYAGTEIDPRLVVWAPNADHVKTVVEKTLSGLKPNLESQNFDRGFTVSLSNRIMDIIDRSELQPDDVRVVQAWTNAMKS